MTQPRRILWPGSANAAWCVSPRPLERTPAEFAIGKGRAGYPLPPFAQAGKKETCKGKVTQDLMHCHPRLNASAVASGFDCGLDDSCHPRLNALPPKT